MKLIDSFLDKVKVFSLEKHEDSRGFFIEKFHSQRYERFGINENFKQDNYSKSKKNVIRGLHFTVNTPQSQLMTVINGKIFDVIVDMREGLPTFGQYKTFILSNEGAQQIYIPHGFAHGFCVLSDEADLHYKTNKFYKAEDERGIIWDDKNISINWPIENPKISLKDSKHPSLKDFFSN